MIHKLTHIERESGVEPKSKPALCHGLFPALAPLFKGQDDKGSGTHCRGHCGDGAPYVARCIKA